MQLSTSVAFKHLGKQSAEYFCMEGDILLKYQAYLLGMLCDIITTCEKEGIVYGLSGGTALGAVRHQGFIPWDDDADINILADDYERFRTSFLKEHGEKYLIYDAQTHGYWQTKARVCLKGSKFIDLDYDTGDVEGMFFVDIFLIENTPDNKILRGIHGLMCLAFGLLLSCRCFLHNRKARIAVAKKNPKLLTAVYIKILIGALIFFIPLDTLTKWTWKCYGLCKNSSSQFVNIPSGRKHYFGEMYARAGFVNTIEVPFAGHNWRVCKDYDTYLRILYGADYMIPYTEEQRERHFLRVLQFPGE